MRVGLNVCKEESECRGQTTSSCGGLHGGGAQSQHSGRSWDWGLARNPLSHLCDWPRGVVTGDWGNTSIAQMRQRLCCL